MLNLSQQEYVTRIDELNQALIAAWDQDQRVKSLKIAIQCAKVLSETSVIQFYPSKFVLITDILDTFGEFVLITDILDTFGEFVLITDILDTCGEFVLITDILDTFGEFVFNQHYIDALRDLLDLKIVPNSIVLSTA
jgi:hypothetical protein